MLKVVVVDRSAESRSAIMARLNYHLRSEVNNVALLPQVSVKPLAPEEVRFHAAPDVLIIGAELVRTDLSEVAAIRKLLTQTALIVEIDSNTTTLAQIEQLARIGVDDTISDQISSQDFLRKLILLSRRVQKPKSGTLILVDSGKGGVGVTSITAALGEALLAAGKRTLLIDMDYETQDLSRFLQARPFINDNLQLLFNQTRPVTQEHVEESLVQIWQEVNSFYCLPPGVESDDLYDSRGSHARVMLGVLEVLDSIFDCVVVDAASCRGVMLKALYRVADKVVFVVNNDPATLYASVDKLSKMRGVIDPNADLLIVENSVDRAGLSNKILREEFARASKLRAHHWYENSIPFCKSGCRWPGSSSTPYSAGKDALAKCFDQLVVALGLSEVADRSPFRAKARDGHSSGVEQQMLAARNPSPLGLANLAGTTSASNLGATAATGGAKLPIDRSLELAPESDEVEAPLLSAPQLQIEDQGIRFSRRSSVSSALESSRKISPVVAEPSLSKPVPGSNAAPDEDLDLGALISGARVN